MNASSGSSLDKRLRSLAEGAHAATTPSGLAARISGKIRLDALHATVRRRYLNHTAILAIVFIAATTCLAAFALLAGLPSLLRYGFAGGRGYIDYWTTSFSLPESPAIIVTALGAGIAIFSIAWFLFFKNPRRRA